MVSIQGGTFYPAEITVAAGTIITWANKNDGAQSVTSDNGLFDGIVSGNGTYSYMFSTTGTYQYYNRITPNMTGKVIVN